MAKEAKRPFIFLDDQGRAAAKLAQEWAKWVLDTLRNFVVVAVLFALAEKSGKWYVWAIACVGFFALYLHLNAHMGQLQIYTGIAKTPGLRILLILVVFIAISAVTFLSVGGLMLAILELASIQK